MVKNSDILTSRTIISVATTIEKQIYCVHCRIVLPHRIGAQFSTVGY